MLDAIRSIDAFPKAYEDYRVKTASGALGKSKTRLFAFTDRFGAFLSLHHHCDHHGMLIHIRIISFHVSGKPRTLASPCFSLSPCSWSWITCS